MIKSFSNYIDNDLLEFYIEVIDDFSEYTEWLSNNKIYLTPQLSAKIKKMKECTNIPITTFKDKVIFKFLNKTDWAIDKYIQETALNNDAYKYFNINK